MTTAYKENQLKEELKQKDETINKLEQVVLDQQSDLIICSNEENSTETKSKYAWRCLKKHAEIIKSIKERRV